MLATTLIQCLRKHGQLMDAEVAAETGIPLDLVRALLNGVSERGGITSCSVTNYNDGKPVEGFLYRIEGYRPPKKPGRKSAPQKPN